MASHQARGNPSFSLFPSSASSSPRPSLNIQARRSESRERRAMSPQQHPMFSYEPSLSPDGVLPASPPPPFSSLPPLQHEGQPSQSRALCPQSLDEPSEDFAVHQASIRQEDASAQNHIHQLDALGVGSSRIRAQQPRLTIEVPRQLQPAPVQIPVLAAANAGPVRSSISKPPFSNGPSFEHSSQPLQSFFPTYNPDLPLQQQNYAPAQMSQPQVPRTVINRQTYFEDQEMNQGHIEVSDHSHGAADRLQSPPVAPKITSTEQSRELWKVANGWKASNSEGQVFCLRLAQQKDAPVYTLSTDSQPFYSLRLDPTSASANVTLSRHGPAKGFKPPKSSSKSPNGLLAMSSRNSENKNWQEAISTTLEEESRKHQPNDGLVALLMPSGAAKASSERPDDPHYAAAAERECARLVWDDDSSSHFLVHPALATPFRVTVEHSPAWCRFEYTLEHHESPNHLAKLTRDGTGGGWLEIDTGIASKIEAFYIVDVAVTALLLMAAIEDRRAPSANKTFDAPPVPETPKQFRGRSSILSRMFSGGEERATGKKKKNKDKDKASSKMEQFEIDLESQDGSLGKGKSKRRTNSSENKAPFLLRVIAKLASGIFNSFIWILTCVFGCFKGVFMLLYRCVGSKY